jgi:hypothetical protein
MKRQQDWLTWRSTWSPVGHFEPRPSDWSWAHGARNLVGGFRVITDSTGHSSAVARPTHDDLVSSHAVRFHIDAGGFAARAFPVPPSSSPRTRKLQQSFTGAGCGLIQAAISLVKKAATEEVIGQGQREGSFPVLDGGLAPGRELLSELVLGADCQLIMPRPAGGPLAVKCELGNGEWPGWDLAAQKDSF